MINIDFYPAIQARNKRAKNAEKTAILALVSGMMLGLVLILG